MIGIDIVKEGVSVSNATLQDYILTTRLQSLPVHAEYKIRIKHDGWVGTGGAEDKVSPLIRKTIPHTLGYPPITRAWVYSFSPGSLVSLRQVPDTTFFVSNKQGFAEMNCFVEISADKDNVHLLTTGNPDSPFFNPNRSADWNGIQTLGFLYIFEKEFGDGRWFDNL